MKQITRVRVEPMVPADLPRVCAIEQDAFASPWPKDAYRSELQHNKSAYYVVARDEMGSVVGFAGMWVIFDEAHITTLAVDPHRRREGIGSRLLMALVDAALARGARWLTLEVRPSNVDALALYRKFGLRDVALRRRYYSDNGEDAVVMWTGNLRDSEAKSRLDALRLSLGE